MTSHKKIQHNDLNLKKFDNIEDHCDKKKKKKKTLEITHKTITMKCNNKLQNNYNL